MLQQYVGIGKAIEMTLLGEPVDLELRLVVAAQVSDEKADGRVVKIHAHRGRRRLGALHELE